MTVFFNSQLIVIRLLLAILLLESCDHNTRTYYLQPKKKEDSSRLLMSQLIARRRVTPSNLYLNDQADCTHRGEKDIDKDILEERKSSLDEANEEKEIYRRIKKRAKNKARRTRQKAQKKPITVPGKRENVVTDQSASIDKKEVEVSQGLKADNQGITSEIKIGTNYQYEDNDIQAILKSRYQGLLETSLKDFSKPIYVLAAVDDIIGQQLKKRLKQDKKVNQGVRVLLIPCNLGNYHWVGILIEIDVNEQVIRAEYIDSLKTSVGIPEVLKKQLKEVYPNCSFQLRSLLKQVDITSCGAYMIENLLCAIRNSPVPKAITEGSKLTTTHIRRQHLEFLKIYNPVFYEGFYIRQRDNKSTVLEVHEQLGYHTKNRDKNKDNKFSVQPVKGILVIIRSFLTNIENKKVRNQLWDIKKKEYKDNPILLGTLLKQIAQGLDDIKDKEVFKNLIQLLFGFKWDGKLPLEINDELIVAITRPEFILEALKTLDSGQTDLISQKEASVRNSQGLPDKNKTLHNRSDQSTIYETLHRLSGGTDSNPTTKLSLSLSKEERSKLNILENLIKTTDLHSYGSFQKPLSWLEEIVKMDTWPDTLHSSWRDNSNLLIDIVKEGASDRVIKALIEREGAEIHAQDKLYETVLHAAVRRGGEDALRQLPILIELGADKEAQNKDSVTPLDLAAEQKKLTVFKLLVELGAGAKATPSKINLFYQALSSEEKEQLSPYIVKLTQINPKIGWKISLDELFPLQGQAKTILKTVTEGDRIITEEAWVKLFEKAGKPKRPNSYGDSDVPYIEKNGQRIYVKFFPKLPGTELAVINLAESLLGYCVPYCELATIDDIPVLLTQGIPGETIYEVLKIYPERLSQLDSESVSKALILAMLINPGDGNLGNYILSPFTNSADQIRYRLISIDNEQAFMPAVAKPIKADSRWSNTPTLQVKTILYCLDDLKAPVNSAVINKIKNADLLDILENWLNSLKIHHQAIIKRFNSTLSRKYQEDKTTILGVTFAPGMIKQLFTKLMRLQTALNKKNPPLHLELLEHLEPFVAHRYRPVIQNVRLDAMERFIKLEHTTKEEKVLTSSSNNLAHLLISREIPDMNKLQTGLWSGKYGPDQAFRELQEVKEQHTKVQQDLKNLPAGLLEKKLQEMDQTQLSSLQQREVLEAVREQELRYVNLKNCNALTRTILISFKLDHIKKLDVSGCSRLKAITTKSWGIGWRMEIERELVMPSVTHLILDNSSIKTILLQADHLLKLRVRDCLKLDNIILKASQPKKIDLRGTTSLSQEKIKSVVDGYPNTFIFITPTSNFSQQKCAEFLNERFLACKAKNKGMNKLALDFLTQSATLGWQYAQYSLALAYEQGEGVKKDEIQAADWYIKAANQGHSHSVDHLVKLALKKHKVALDWIISRAEKDTDKEIQYTLGLIYEQGRGVKRNVDKAAEYYIESDRQKHSDAASKLRNLSLKGCKHARDWVRNEAIGENGKEAQYTLGQIYEQGKGVAKDNLQASSWYMRAADQAYWDAFIALSNLALKGDHVAQAWIKEKALEKNKEAQYALGQMFEQGKGVEQDVKKAAIYYIEALKQGKLQASDALMKLVAEGNIFVESMIRAEVKHRDTWCQYTLGRMYEEGIGVKQDKEKAIGYYLEAAKQGNKAAQYKLVGLLYYDKLEKNRIEVNKNYYQEALGWIRELIQQPGTNVQNNLAWVYRRAKMNTENEDNRLPYLYDFYFVRHGQTDWGPEDILKGPQDLGLNYIGVQQACEAGEILKRLLANSSKPKMISSSLQRAIETAKKVEEATGILVSAVKAEWKERYYGDYSSMINISQVPPDAENEESFQERVLQALASALLEYYNDAKPLIIVSHQKVFECVAKALIKSSEKLPQGGIGYFMLGESGTWN